MSCECPNQQQMCEPVRGLPYNPQGIPFIDEELEEDATSHHMLHAVIVCNDLRSPEAQGLIGDVTPTRHAGDSQRRRRAHPKANDVRVHAAERVGVRGGGSGGSGGGASGGRRGSLRRSLRGLANKVRRGNSVGGELSDGRMASSKPDCRATLLSLLLSGSYVLLAVIAAVVTYALVSHLVEALRYPVRAVRYRQVDTHTAPAIVLLAGGAVLSSCANYYQNAVPSMVRLGQLDLVNQNCSYVNVTEEGRTGGSSSRLVVRGPAAQHEALFLHFAINDSARDFYSISYFVFPGWDAFNFSSEENRTSELQRLSKTYPTSTLGAGFKFWVRLSAKETHFLNSDTHVKLKTQHSAVKYWDRRPFHERNRTHLFFIFFEWKDNLVEETYFLYTTTAWHVGACLCAVFLTLHKAYTFLRASVKRAKRNRRKRKYSSLNSKSSKAEAEEHSCECACAEAADKNQSCDNES